MGIQIPPRAGALHRLWGKAPVIQEILLESSARRPVRILPTASYAPGPGRVEVTGHLPRWGENLPVGIGGSVGYRLTWGLNTDPGATLVDLVGGF